MINYKELRKEAIEIIEAERTSLDLESGREMVVDFILRAVKRHEEPTLVKPSRSVLHLTEQECKVIYEKAFGVESDPLTFSFGIIELGQPEAQLMRIVDEVEMLQLYTGGGMTAMELDTRTPSFVNAVEVVKYLFELGIEFY